MKYQKYPAQTIKVAGDLRRAPATFENPVKTGTDPTTDWEQFTRSNAPTAKLPTLVRLAETLTRDWLNTNKPQEMVMLTITLLYIINWQTITLTATLPNTKPTVQTIFNSWLWKAGTLTYNKHFSHTKCHLSTTQQCNSTLLTILSTSQRNRIGVNNRKKLPKCWYTSIRNGRVGKLFHSLARKENWIMWPSVKLTSYSNPGPPFSMREFNILPLLQPQPAGKTFTHTEFHLSATQQCNSTLLTRRKSIEPRENNATRIKKLTKSWILTNQLCWWTLNRLLAKISKESQQNQRENN